MIFTITKEAEVNSDLIYKAIQQQLKIVSKEATIPSDRVGTAAIGYLIKKLKDRLELIDELGGLLTTADDAEEDTGCLTIAEQTEMLASIGDRINDRSDLLNALKMVF